jgi:hypothetical protein
VDADAGSLVGRGGSGVGDNWAAGGVGVIPGPGAGAQAERVQNMSMSEKSSIRVSIARILL